MNNICDLYDRKCKPCEGGIPPLKQEEAENLLQQLEQRWQLAFVNAVAWISHQEDHHPDMLVGYNRCHVEYTTHAIGGLSENDFICAAKVDMLLVS